MAKDLADGKFVSIEDCEIPNYQFIATDFLDVGFHGIRYDKIIFKMARRY